MLGAKGKPNYFELVDVPKDSISGLTFHPVEPDVLLATSWDESAYIYQVSSNKCIAKATLTSPILSGVFNPLDSSSAFLGDLDGNVYAIQQNKKSNIGKHRDGVQSLCVIRQHTLASGSWDSSVLLFDSRTFEKPNSISLAGPLYTMDAAEYNLVVGLADRHIHIYDIRNPSQPVQKRESSLKYQTRAIKCFPHGYICSSIEGRVAVEYFENNGQLRYAFKCHRQEVQAGEEMVHSVNAVAVHPGRQTTFATGGSDGNVFMWDLEHKKRIKHLSPTQISPGVSALAFSPDGGSLAIASSHCFERGQDASSSPVRILIRRLSDSDISLKKI